MTETDAPSALARLVGDVATFLDQHWGRRPLHVPAGSAPEGPAGSPGLAGLLSLDDVDELVSGGGLRAPSFRLVQRGRTLPQSSVTRRVRIGSRPVSDLIDVGAVHRSVADGATLVLQGLHRSFGPVEGFCRELAATLAHPVQANAYLTPPISQGLNLHGDPHDVFAVQTYGTKRWVVHPPVERDADGNGSAASPEPWDLQLEAGDVLYLPAGTRHAAQTQGVPSLHLTIGVRTVTWRDLVRRLVDAGLAGHDALDESLPAGWAERPEELEDELRRRLDGALEAVVRAAPAPAIAEEARALRSSRPSDLRGRLRDLLEADHIEDATPLERRDDIEARLRDAGDRVELVLADRTLRLPATVAPALRQLLDRPMIRPADLDPFLDAPSRLVLCRRAVREGLLRVLRDGEDPARG